LRPSRMIGTALRVPMYPTIPHIDLIMVDR